MRDPDIQQEAGRVWLPEHDGPHPPAPTTRQESPMPDTAPAGDTPTPIVTSTELATRPDCPAGHGAMDLREKPSVLAAELGTWYDCHHHRTAPNGGCKSSTLLMVPWLAAQYAATPLPSAKRTVSTR